MIGYLKLYAHQLLSQVFGKKIEIKKHEKIEERVIETKEEMPSEAEISIFKLEEKPEYELNIKIPAEREKGYLEMRIEKITTEQLKNFYEKLRKIFEK